MSTKDTAVVDLVVSLNMSRASLINHELTTPINGAVREATNQRAASKPFSAYLPDRPSNVACHSWSFFSHDFLFFFLFIFYLFLFFCYPFLFLFIYFFFFHLLLLFIFRFCSLSRFRFGFFNVALMEGAEVS